MAASVNTNQKSSLSSLTFLLKLSDILDILGGFYHLLISLLLLLFSGYFQVAINNTLNYVPLNLDSISLLGLS